MENVTTFKDKIAPDIQVMLSDYSKRLNISEIGLIEKAVRKYVHELKRDEYQESFARAKQDEDISELTETGIDDFLEMIEK